jgi:hypothetical protein
LVVMDNCPACLEILRVVASSLPKVNHRYFTLLHCCPTIYWEHGGGTDPETQHEIDAVWQAEEDEYNLTEQYLDESRRILQEAGVADSHIRTITAVEADSLVAATTLELRRGTYSGQRLQSGQLILRHLHRQQIYKGRAVWWVRPLTTSGVRCRMSGYRKHSRPSATSLLSRSVGRACGTVT